MHAALMQEADLDRTVASTNTALNEDQNFYGTSPTLKANLSAGMEKYQAANSSFIEALKKLATGDTTVSATDFLDAGMKARETSFSYWRTSVDELDGLLHARIATFQSKRTVSLALALLAVVAACALAFVLTRSITRPLLGLVKSLGPGTTLLGVCVEQISEASKTKFSDPDEARMIVQELNANCDTMRKAVAELEAQVTGHSSKS